MLAKLAYSIERSFEIPNSEKDIGLLASKYFLGVVNLFALSKDQLDIIYNPFKKDENVSPEELKQRRGKLNIYKQQIKKDFEEIKQASFRAMKEFNYFASDSHALSLLNSFEDSVGNWEKQVEVFLDILDNYSSPEFRTNLLSSIESVRKEALEVEKLIKDRIIPFIDDNILTKGWVSDVGDNINSQIQDKIPLITELYNERQKALEVGKRPQSLNPTQSQKMTHPTDMRDLSEKGE